MPLSPCRYRLMPPSELLVWRLTTPSTMAWTLLPRGFMMSTPLWARPPERAAPQESTNENGLDTGQDVQRPLIRWVVLNPARWSVTCLAFSKVRVNLATVALERASSLLIWSIAALTSRIAASKRVGARL